MLHAKRIVMPFLREGTLEVDAGDTLAQYVEGDMEWSKHGKIWTGRFGRYGPVTDEPEGGWPSAPWINAKGGRGPAVENMKNKMSKTEFSET
jgi:hypothetical protein